MSLSKVIVMGCGYWGKNFVRELAGNLVAVIEPDQKKAMWVTEKYRVPVYPSLPKGLEFDSACIVTPPSTHVELALPLLEQGKHVLIEKPLALSVEDAMRLYPYKERVMAAHLYHYHPCIDEMREWLKHNPIDHAFARRTNSGPVRPWQNAMWDLTAHDISVFNLLFGKPLGVEATGAFNWVLLRLDYATVSAAIYASWLGKPKERRIELVPVWCPDCDNALDDGCNQRYVFNDVTTVLEVTPLRRLLDAFLSGSWDRCTLDQGIEVLQVLEAASAGIH